LLVPKSHPHLLHVDNTILVIVDMQEPFLRTLFEPERVIANVCALAQGANILRLPILATTQNGEKMGNVLPEIRRLLPPLLPPFDKLSFSCYAAPAFASEIQRSGRRQVLLCGVESHICVSQTAHELQDAGFQVHVVADAVSARSEANWRLGLEKMRQSGIFLSSVEMALYELLREAGTPEFREVLKIIK
jgi:nicotinamidase-related amidase